MEEHRDMPIKNTLSVRKGTATEWSNANPVLASGEPGFDTTNNILKIGDGSTAWNSLSNHKHTATNITDFNSSVSGLLPVTNISAGSGIIISSVGSVFTVSTSGTIGGGGGGLNTEEVDDRVAALLVSGSGISLSYNDTADSLTISTTGLQPSGNYSTVGHTHSGNDIVSGTVADSVLSNSARNSINIYLWSNFR